MMFKRKKKEILTFSAEFKRDYVAVSALVAFFLILFCEVALAIFIPTYLQRENAMAKEVARYRMAAMLDGLRNRLNFIISREKDELALAEIRLIQWDADLWAQYLRNEKQYLSEREIADLAVRFQKMRILADNIAARKLIPQEYRLNTSAYVNGMLKKEK